MPLLSFIIIDGPAGPEEQMKLFLIAAVAVILVSWVLIRRSQRLAILASALAMIPAAIVYYHVEDTWGWLGRDGYRAFGPMYLALGFACAILPFVSIVAMLLAAKRHPNRPLSPTPTVVTSSASASAETRRALTLA